MGVEGATLGAKVGDTESRVGEGREGDFVSGGGYILSTIRNQSSEIVGDLITCG